MNAALDSGARLDEAADWLRGALSGGARPSADLLEAAKAQDIARRTLHRARGRLAVVVERTGWPARSVWRLPTQLCQEDAVVPSHATRHSTAQLDNGGTTGAGAEAAPAVAHGEPPEEADARRRAREFREMAARATDPFYRRHWTQLADELEAALNRRTHDG